MTKTLNFLIVLLLFAGSCSYASDLTYYASGKLFRQSSDKKDFFLLDDQTMSESLAFGIYAVRHDLYFPLATDTCIYSASSTMTLFPGSVIRFDQSGFMPLTGRIHLSGNDFGDKFAVRNRKFELLIERGNVFLEVTPDDGTFIAVRGETTGIIKTFERKIIELENGSEIHFPLFGKEKISKRLSSFWNSPPSSFSALRLPENETAEDASASDSEEIDPEESAVNTDVLETVPSEALSSATQDVVKD